MRFGFIALIIVILFCFNDCSIKGQSAEQNEVDSLVNVLIKERRQWNDASERLKVIGEPAVDKLLNVLLDKSIDSWPRRKAAITLSGINSPKMITPCLNVFTDETEDIAVRNNACRALFSTDITKYEDFFIEYSKVDGRLRNSCYQQLARIGSEKSINFLVSVVDSCDDMGKWIVLHDLEKYDRDDINQKFIAALDDNTWWMINEYARNVLVKKGEDVLEPINNILSDEENSEFMRWKAIWIIKDLETDKKMPILQNALKDKSWVIRNEAEVALNK